MAQKMTDPVKTILYHSIQIHSIQWLQWPSLICVYSIRFLPNWDTNGGAGFPCPGHIANHQSDSSIGTALLVEPRLFVVWGLKVQLVRGNIPKWRHWSDWSLVNLLGCIKRSCYSPTPVTEFSWFESVPSVSSLTSVFSPVNAENICGNSLYHQPVTNQLKKFSFLKGIVAWPWKFATSVARTSSAHCAAAPCLHPATWKCPASCRIFMHLTIIYQKLTRHLQ